MSMAGLFWEDQPLRKVKHTDDETRILRPVRTVETNWVKPSIFPELEGDVAVDFETNDEGIRKGIGSSWPFAGEGFAVGVAVASASHPEGLYYPTRHEGGGNMEDEGQVYNWLRAQLKKPSVTPIMAHAAYDLGWLRRHDITPANMPIDVLALAALCDENAGSYSLDSILKRFDAGSKSEELLYRAMEEMGFKDVKGNLWRAPAPFVGEYAEGDAAGTLRVLPKLLAEIKLQGLENIADLERRVAMVVFAMRCNGVRVDVERATARAAEFKRLEEHALAQVKEISGLSIDVWDATAIEQALKADGVVTLPRTKKDLPSITRSLLDQLSAQGCKVAGHVADARRYNKARSVFLENYILGHQRNGRVHCEFSALRREDDDGTGFGTVSGRFSSSGFNLQQIPNRDPEIRDAARGCFLPEEGEEWMKGDFASQEPRLAVHFANVVRRNGQPLTGAAEMAKRFWDNPDTDLHGETATRMGIPRPKAKTINLGILYGMKGGTLCLNLGLPTISKRWRGRDILIAGAEGERLMKDHEQAVPFVRELYEVAEQRAKERGCIFTLAGRKCRFYDKGHGEYLFTHKSCNRLIQGSAADQIKTGMVHLYEQHKVVPLVTVHDELGFSVRRGDAEQVALYRKTMEDAIKLSIPFVVDVKLGDNWAACS